MDIKAIAEQIMAAFGDAPEKIQEFIADPAGMIEQITGHALGEGEISQVVEHIKASIENFDIGSIGEKLSGLLGGEDSPLNDLGDMLGNIFKK